MEIERNIMLVFANAVPGRQQEFFRWYEEHHIPYVLETPGLVSAQRFVPSPGMRPDRAPSSVGRDQVVLYELARDGGDVLRDLMARRAGAVAPLSDAYDVASTVLDTWVSDGPLHRPR